MLFLSVGAARDDRPQQEGRELPVGADQSDEIGERTWVAAAAGHRGGLQHMIGSESIHVFPAYNGFIRPDSTRTAPEDGPQSPSR
jgi:hypothetical protein